MDGVNAPLPPSASMPPHISAPAPSRASIFSLATSSASRPTALANASPPRPTTGEGNMLAGAAAAQRRSPETPGTRNLNVTDALSYLDAVKVQFQDRPDVYNQFLDIMKDFKSQVIDTPGVIDRVSDLFQGNPGLIQGFNTFLPPGYRIDVSTDPREPNMITVTTPNGGQNYRISQTQQPSAVTAAPGFALPPLAPPRTHTPLAYGPAPFKDSALGLPAAAYPGAPSMTAEASLLGGLSGNSGQNHPGEFGSAIHYLNKIKERYVDDGGAVYKQFLELLQAYQKDQRQWGHVYDQVQVLFKGAPDLLSEFKFFLPPETVGMIPPPPGNVGILPHPQGDASVPPWTKADAQAQLAAERGEKPKKSSAKRRKRPVDKEPTPPPPAKSSNRSKKAKHHHKPDASSPALSPYQAPASPHNTHHSSHAHQPSSLQIVQHAPQRDPDERDELLFFQRARKALDSRETYEDFLKLLGLFTREIIDTRALVERAAVFLGEGELMNQFKELMGYDDRRYSVENGPPGSIRTQAPEVLVAPPVDDGQGPSYRRLPLMEARLACSGRDELGRSVLNDEWVSHPTWQSEEVGFTTHKKNSFEDALHKSEEERHEYHVQIDGLARTLAVLEPIAKRGERMGAEERAAWHIGPDFGGPGRALYHRTLKRVFKDSANEVITAMQENPAHAVPIVVERLRAKDAEWRRAQREWMRTWREVEAKNFYKSLDYQGISFKASDKKAITAKHFVADIERRKRERDKEHAEKAAEEGRPECARGASGFQLEYTLADTDVLRDAVKLVYTFLDRSAGVYSADERRSVMDFLRAFLPTFLMMSPEEFNAACGGEPPTASEHTSSNGGVGVPAGDLRKQLLKTQMEPRDSPKLSALSSPLTPSSPHTHNDEADAEKSEPESALDKGEEPWIREAGVGVAANFDAPPGATARMPFFANTTFYTLLRLLQEMYARLLQCKQIGAAAAAAGHADLRANPVAVALGLDEPQGPPAVLASYTATADLARAGGNVLYAYLLDAWDKVFDGEMDGAVLEEHMRWFFGNKAYLVFTLDKLIIALVKQVQTVVADTRCQDLWALLQAARRAHAQGTSNRAIIRYRRAAEHTVDDNLYRVEWDPETRMLRMQVMDDADASVSPDARAVGAVARWREYVDAYVLPHQTEWVPAGAQLLQPFLRRCLPAEDTPSPEPGAVEVRGDLAVRVSLGTYKLFYASGTEESVWRVREEGGLRERAERRMEERRRCRLLQ